MTQTPQPSYSLRLLACIFLPFAAGYFLSYLYRVVNNIIVDDLAIDLQLDANQLGLLTSVYLLAFASTQLPLGVLLDRYGPRRIEAALLLFAALGAAIFALAETSTGLLLGRALIGFGVSACLMAAFKAVVQWFPPERLPLVNGLLLAAGGFGVLTAASPIEFALGFTDWRGVFWVLAGLTFLSALAIYFLVPDYQKSAGEQKSQPSLSMQQHLAGVKTVFTSPEFWRITPWVVVSQAAAMSVVGLWSKPWLQDVAGIDSSSAAFILSLNAIALIVGFSLLGAITDWLGRKFGIAVMSVVEVCLLIYFGFQLLLIFNIGTPAIIWIGYTFFNSAGVLSYAALSQKFPAALAGRVNTGLNLLVFIAAFAMQWGVGVIVNQFSTDTPGSYQPEGYAVAFSVLLLLQLLPCAWYYISKRRL